MKMLGKSAFFVCDPKNVEAFISDVDSFLSGMVQQYYMTPKMYEQWSMRMQKRPMTPMQVVILANKFLLPLGYMIKKYSNYPTSSGILVYRPYRM